METNEFFESLEKDYQDFFMKINFIPKNSMEANDYIRSYFQLDKLESFDVQLSEPIKIEDSWIKNVPVSLSNPFYACLPRVWQTMDYFQRLKASKMIYLYLLREITPRIVEKPELVFVNYVSQATSVGHFDPSLNILYLSLWYIISAPHPMGLIGTMAHELQHIQQLKQRKRIEKRLEDTNFECYNELTKYDRELLYYKTSVITIMLADLYKEYASKTLEEIEKDSQFSKEDIELWFKLEKEKNNSWINLKKLPYAFNANEYSADIQKEKIAIKILRNYYKNEEKYYMPIKMCKNYIEQLKDDGFDISIKQRENFAQIGYSAHLLINSNKFKFSVLGYLLFIYKEKKVAIPFLKNFEKLEKEYYEYQKKLKQSKQQKENEEK